MKGDPVPNDDHIARYCGGSHVKEGGSISGTAFRLRERSGRPAVLKGPTILECVWRDLVHQG